jgi:hypothetical protein
VLVGSDYEETVAAEPLHIECPSKQALKRRISDIDKDAAFVWFSGESEAQGRGAVMVYLPIDFDATRLAGGSLRDWIVLRGFLAAQWGWEPAMLRGVSRGELAHLEESGRAVTAASRPGK